MIPDFVTVFAGNGNGTTSNDTAFTNAEASAYERIWLPEGRFKTSKTSAQLLKRYEGPGKILASNGAEFLQGFAALATLPSPVGGEYGEGGDTQFADVEWKEIRPNARTSLVDQTYWQAGGSVRFSRFFNRGGESGTLAYLAATASSGATTATLNSVDGIAVNDFLGFMKDNDTPPIDTVKVTAINATTKVITFTPALTTTYTVGGTDYAPKFLNNYTELPCVTKGRRTMNPYHVVMHGHSGGGDSYAWAARVTVDYVPKTGQAHFFNTATGGLIGGDMAGTQNGVYLTGWECRYSDRKVVSGSNVDSDIACIGSVNSYERYNDTGARGVAWVHDYAKSEGTKPIEVFWLARGKGKVGIDLAGADFSSESQRAIQLSTGQRIYFDAEISVGPTVKGRSYWHNVRGDTYLTHGFDGFGQFLDAYVGAGRLRVREDSLNFNGAIQSNTTINAVNGVSGNTLAATTTVTAGTDITTSGGDIYTTKSGGQLAVPTNGTIRLGGIGSSTYLQFTGAAIFLVKNGSVVQTW